MTGRDAIKAALEASKGNLEWYVSDFSDADLLVRPVPGANHAAWQIGNVIGGAPDGQRAGAMPGTGPGMGTGTGVGGGANGGASDSSTSPARLLPLGPEQTLVTGKWLVHRDAEVGQALSDLGQLVGAA